LPTSLFEVQELPRYFSVAYEDGDFFILTWRASDARPLPDRLLTILELKRSGILHFPFAERFMTLLTHTELSASGSGTEDQLLHGVSDFEQIREVLGNDLEMVFRSELLALVSSGASRTLLLRILKTTKKRFKLPILTRCSVLSGSRVRMSDYSSRCLDT
jgi:hypothetical protein